MDVEDKSIPVPSPVIPFAVASAFVPPTKSDLKSFHVLLPLPETAALNAAAVAVDTAVRSPLLVTVSLPDPASIAVASAFADDDIFADAAPDNATATVPAPLTAVETAVTAPSFVMVSVPEALVRFSSPARLSPSVST